jgi:hypothetical protein
MPILPLDHPEPFAATLGVMLYPETDEDQQRKARAFAARWLTEPFRRFHEAGGQLPYDALARIFVDAGKPLSDVEDRYLGGTEVGELFKALFILAKDHPKLASWENAIKIYKISASRDGARGSRSDLWRQLTRFRTVAHLWGAWSIREGKFETYPEFDYEGRHDFLFFITEAEILRDFGQNWRPLRASSEPPLTQDVWRVPSDWQPPPKQDRWPNTGMIPDLKLPDELVAELKPAGRPRKTG